MAINLCAYKKPSTPSAIPLLSPAQSAARPAKSLAGVRSVCRLLRQNPTSTVNQELPLLAYPLSPALAHLLMPSVQFLSQRIKLGIVNPKLLPPAPSPADPISFFWKQSSWSSSPSSSSRRAEHRRVIAVVQEPSEHRRSPLPGRYLAGDSSETLATVSTPSLSSTFVRS
jgi:hypothetical protein